MKVVDYTQDQLFPFARAYHTYWTDVEGREPDECIEGEGVVTNELQYKIYTYLQEGAKIKLAYHNHRLIGFMIYNWVLDCVLMVRAIWMDPEHRSSSRFRRLIFSVGKVRRVFSQTYIDREPEEIRGEKRNRTLVCQRDGMNIWENFIGEKHGDSQQTSS